MLPWKQPSLPGLQRLSSCLAARGILSSNTSTRSRPASASGLVQVTSSAWSVTAHRWLNKATTLPEGSCPQPRPQETGLQVVGSLTPHICDCQLC